MEEQGNTLKHSLGTVFREDHWRTDLIPRRHCFIAWSRSFSLSLSLSLSLFMDSFETPMENFFLPVTILLSLIHVPFELSQWWFQLLVCYDSVHFCSKFTYARTKERRGEFLRHSSFFALLVDEILTAFSFDMFFPFSVEKAWSKNRSWSESEWRASTKVNFFSFQWDPPSLFLFLSLSLSSSWRVGEGNERS